MLEQMTTQVRDMLIEHLAGPVAIDRRARSHRHQVRNALLRRGMIRDEAVTAPRFSVITKKGREAITAFIADMRAAIARAEANVWSADHADAA
jgi:hypothetical protein